MQRFNEELEKRFGVHRTAEYRETRFSDQMLEMARYAIYHDTLTELRYLVKCLHETQQFRVDWTKVEIVLRQIRIGA